ncbi:MAG: cobyrinic acid a,c-diamide synthase [Nitrospirae bacterium CG18_big_fil_WC_8_21_14_2_50_70_55]|nr:hydrogenobyrinic acid a,c-diamide synthase (glutamine-hydrolyzing) [Deltaproteobacteria bacterium]OIP66321.1 MAG: hypothetical protein AUK30_02710 [Nitrospirae bacterium CG2_30_70_394]PIQ06494.1 MAG: cobyrinic acid a,c-diamide synthase [Nitrospirae bacterium CG18_big_fil_WC_8_21_14_2_50_70_55]PIU79432.1 MAG: cobyrinic acid a,c-diamide synthase [Nitrospirae bacterium CG06_land_8_20_14_3_00_70_43]PIW82275.1 MAG: cobyrinic acid a,c-diamide synthase [Nitrospirae bacterium CG_4_8_14_3_um_filter_7
MSLTLDRLVVAGAHRSSGKTTLAIALAAAFTGAGVAVQPYKKGPDFIDPMWLTLAAGRPCHTLDFFFHGNDAILPAFAAPAAGAALALIEGNIGLHDGVDVEGSDTTAALACRLAAPVLLVVNCQGMTRGIAPLLLGLRDFPPRPTLGGVVLNQVGSARHQAKLIAAIDRYVGLPILGALPHLADGEVRQRHLGITPVAEASQCQAVVARLGAAARDDLDLDRIREIAATAPDLDLQPAAPIPPIPAPRVLLGVAQDGAFTFYYPENLAALRQAGAELVFFSPLTDDHLPDVDGLYLGGGFPEFHAARLAANVALRGEIERRGRDGMAIYAECGGLMYLSRALTWHGKRHPMVGLLPCAVEMTDRPQAGGYCRLTPTALHPWGGGVEVRAHEFHHSRVVGYEGGGDLAFRVERGHGLDGSGDGIVVGHTVANYAHLHTGATPDWAARFVDFVAATRRAA